jgi:FTR1 family protein
MTLLMMRMGKNFRGKLESDLDHTLDKDPRRTKWAIFVLIFVQCFREGLETFLFLFGAQVSESGPVNSPDAWKGFFIPGLLGLIVLVGVAYFVFRGLLHFDIQYILILSSIILMFLAAGLTTRAFHELREANALGKSEPGDTLKIAWWNASIWSINSCCDSTHNEFFATLHALFGFRDSSSFIHVTACVGYWLIILPLIISFNWRKLCSARDRIAIYARGMAGTAVICFVIGFIYAVSHSTWTGILTTMLGLIMFIAAGPALIDMLVDSLPDVKYICKHIALATVFAFFLFALLATILPIIQISSLDKSLAKPARCPSFIDGV